jgi:hypothetical protein
MPLLDRWHSSLTSEGSKLDVVLLSVDEREADLAGALSRKLPGEVRWLRSPDDLAPLLESLGVDKTAPIPIHALVDPDGFLRCVRVGSLREEAYGAVKALFLGR